MNFMLRLLLLSTFLTLSCSSGKLEVLADLPLRLSEASAVEKVAHSNLLWTIEDAGNKNNIYGFNLKGKLIKNIDIENASNIDWEDLTSDENGNLYIGDFGNNSKNRDDFTIYKVSNLKDGETAADRINFTLPKKVKPQDFEGFFLLYNHFYIFSKEHKKTKLFKVLNETGKQKAELISEYKFGGKRNKITSAAISNDGKTVVLLNHDKLWKITDFNGDNFFEGKIEAIEFDHSSQKEGICFKTNSSVYITDEKNKSEGGNLYEFKLN